MNNNKGDLFKDDGSFKGALYKKVAEVGGEKNIGAKEDSNLTTYLIVAVVAFVLGVGVGRLGKGGEISTAQKINGDTDISSSTPNTFNTALDGRGDNFGNGTGLLSADDYLVIDNQAAGSEIIVKEIKVSKSGWLAIREDNGLGEPGNILGAQLFDPGMTAGKVELLRNTEEGKTYYAVIFSDNGDRAFIPKMDLPVLVADGMPLSVTFKATK